MTIIEQILSDYFIYKCACYSYDNSRDNSPHVAVCSSRLTAWTWIYNSFKARGQLAPILAVSRAFHFPFSASCTDLPQNHTQFPPRFEQKKKPHLTERHWTRFNQADFFFLTLSRSVLITYFPIWLSTPPPPPWLISLLMVHATQYLHLPAGLHICAFWLPYQLISMFVNELNWIGIDCINKFVH